MAVVRGGACAVEQVTANSGSVGRRRPTSIDTDLSPRRDTHGRAGLQRGRLTSKKAVGACPRCLSCDLDPDRIRDIGWMPARSSRRRRTSPTTLTLRLPGSNLAGLAEELARVAVATEERGRQARRPILAIRALSALAIGLALLGLWYLARHIHARWEFGTIDDVFEALNAGFNLLVLLAGALWFCVTLEARIKRKEALGFIEELREFAHVIDVTQLYYTPTSTDPATGPRLATRPSTRPTCSTARRCSA